MLQLARNYRLMDMSDNYVVRFEIVPIVGFRSAAASGFAGMCILLECGPDA